MSEGLHSSAPVTAQGARSSATHDPLCAFAPCECWKDGSGFHYCGTDTCQCKLIAKVRADERAQAGSRVAALPYWCDWSDGLVVYRSSAIGAAEGGDDK